MKVYFTIDGSYGGAEESDMVIIDTSHWSKDDWEKIEDCSDMRRFEQAKGIKK